MREIYLVNVGLHVVAALVWVGGMFFLALVGAPVLRKVEPAALRSELFRELGERFRAVGWVCIAVLFVTGLFNLAFRGLLDAGTLASAAFWRSPYGAALAWKLGGVTLMVVLSAVHDFVDGPRASRLHAGSPEAARARRRAALWARLNAVLGLLVVLAAVRLPR